MADEKPEPLIIAWTGEKKPPSSASIGLLTIALPDEATQRAGFEHEHAALLLRNLASNKGGYKRKV